MKCAIKSANMPTKRKIITINKPAAPIGFSLNNLIKKIINLFFFLFNFADAISFTYSADFFFLKTYLYLILGSNHA